MTVTRSHDDHARRTAWAIANAGEARGAAARDSETPRLAPKTPSPAKAREGKREGAQP